MVANKMIGEKGILFTATYVSKFDEMEKQLRMQQPKLINKNISSNHFKPYAYMYSLRFTLFI